MKIFAKEQLSPHKYKTKEGYLICTDAILARTGKQTYRKSDFFPDAADADIDIEIDRPEKEVCDASAVASFENKPICIEHPDDDVTVDNYKNLAVGYVRDVKITELDGQKVMTGNLVFTDKSAIDLIESGQYTQLSCGYDCEVLDENNPSMSHIRGNHVALCREGRAGIAKIQDSKAKDTSWDDIEEAMMSNKYHGPMYSELDFNDCLRGFETKVDAAQASDFIEKTFKLRTDILSTSDGYYKVKVYGVTDSKVKDTNSYLVTSKRYDIDALKQGFNVEGYGDVIRVWGPRFKLDAWIKSYDADEPIHYAVIKDSVKDEWQYVDCENLDEVSKLSSFCSKHNCHIATKTPTKEGYKCRIEGPFDDCHYVRDRWSMYKFRGEVLDSVKDTARAITDSKAKDDKFDDLCKMLDKAGIDYSDAGYNPSMFWFTSKAEFDKAKALLEKKYSIRTTINKHGHYVIEVKDSTVKDANTKSNLIKALDVLATKFKLIKEGETWTGKKHFEFESKDVVKNFRTQMYLIGEIIDRFDNAYHCVSTYNAILKSDGHVNIVVDVDDKHAHDSKKSATDAIKAVKLIESIKVCNFQSKK